MSTSKETAADYACRECGATRGFQLVMKLGMDYNDVNRRAVMLAYPTIENWAPKNGDVRQYEVADIIEGEYNCARALFDPRKPRGKKAASNAPHPQDPTQDDPTDYSPEWWCPNCGEVAVDLDDLVDKVPDERVCANVTRWHRRPVRHLQRPPAPQC
jgi:predicted RNA-binding Zn-ribbon protein involved in translation (DUF1610 family)